MEEQILEGGEKEQTIHLMESTFSRHNMKTDRSLSQRNNAGK
jgi:hypothetical protein